MSTNRISESFPPPEEILRLEPEDLAVHLIRFLDSLGERDMVHFSRQHDFVTQLLNEYPDEHCDSVSRAFVEAWEWLYRQGFIVPDPHLVHGRVYVTKSGKDFSKPQGPRAYRDANIMFRDLLHKRIASTVGRDFQDGHYEKAVHEAFRAVEHAVHEAAGLGQLFGVNLMRAAFHPGTGPLSDLESLPAEQQGFSDLFAAAIGCYKNPGSHRYDPPSAPKAAAEMIVMASHLLRIVYERKAHKDSGDSGLQGPPSKTNRQTETRTE